MLKIIGMVLVVGVCAYGGNLKKNSLSERKKQLQALLFALNNMEQELGYGREPMNIILRQVAAASEGIVADFLETVAVQLSKNDGSVLSEIWQKELVLFQNKMSLEAEDLRFLREFACGLGVSHTEDQLRRIRLTAVHLEHQLSLAEENALRLGKVFQASGWCLGLVLALLLV